jgi:hypothetical protein
MAIKFVSTCLGRMLRRDSLFQVDIRTPDLPTIKHVFWSIRHEVQHSWYVDDHSVCLSIITVIIMKKNKNKHLIWILNVVEFLIWRIWSYFWQGYMRSLQCNVELLHQPSICPTAGNSSNSPSYKTWVPTSQKIQTPFVVRNNQLFCYKNNHCFCTNLRKGVTALCSQYVYAILKVTAAYINLLTTEYVMVNQSPIHSLFLQFFTSCIYLWLT